MPLDQSDRIRKLQEIKIFQGWAIQKQVTQPGVNVSSCTGFNAPSTIKQFSTYNYGQQVVAGRPYFSTCQGTN